MIYKNLKIKGKAIYCNTASITSRVLRLHECKGHPAMEAMCNAIDLGAWQNSNLTVDQVRRAMNQNMCLPCILAKKNKPKIKSPSMDTLVVLQVGISSGRSSHRPEMDVFISIYSLTREQDI
jgi:hypothetical protein